MVELDEKQLPSEKVIMYRTNGTLMRIADNLERIAVALEKQRV